VKKKRFSIEQITAVLHQAETGIPVNELCRQVGVSEQTFYRWRKAYSGLAPSGARELKQLRDENTKLKRVVADLTLDRVKLQDVIQNSSAARQATRKSARPEVRAIRRRDWVDSDSSGRIAHFEDRCQHLVSFPP
jgi:putative transposase